MSNKEIEFYDQEMHQEMHQDERELNSSKIHSKALQDIIDETAHEDQQDELEKVMKCNIK